MEPIERYLLAAHRCGERCRQRGRGLKEHNRWAIAVLNAYGDIRAQPFIKAAVKRGDMFTLEQLSQRQQPQ